MKLNDYKLAFSEPSDLSKFNRKSRTLEELISIFASHIRKKNNI